MDDILSAEAQAQQSREKAAELAKIMKLRLVLKNLQKLRVEQLDLPDDGEQVELVLKMLSVYMNLRLSEENNDCLLNLEELRSASVSYTERKTIRQQLAIILRKKLQPIVELGRKLHIEIPEAFLADRAAGAAAPTSLTAKILALESQTRCNLQGLAELRSRKCSYLKVAAELKMGPYLQHELELLCTQVKLCQVKASVLRRYFVKELVTGTEHGLKALKEAEAHVDEALLQLGDE